MQYQVPQFIEYEPKLLWFLTVKQSLYLGVAAGIIFLLKFMGLSFFVFISISVFIGAVALALAFARPHGRPFTHFLGTMFGFTLSPKVFVWQRKPERVEKVEKPKEKEALAPEEKPVAKGESRMGKLGKRMGMGI